MYWIDRKRQLAQLVEHLTYPSLVYHYFSCSATTYLMKEISLSNDIDVQT